MTARTTLRRAARSTRRVWDGGRGLGLGTTARWWTGRQTASDAPAENSSLTWVHVADDRTTIVWIPNYWSETYDISEPVVHGSIHAADGREIATFTESLPADGTARLDLREIIADAACRPFDGQLLLRLRDPHLFAGRPLQVFAEYRRDDGECSGVHGQYGLVDRPLGQVVSSMRVEAGSGRRTGFVLTNGYDGPGGPRPMHAALVVHAADGSSVGAAVPPVPPLGTVVAYADELVPDLAHHLGGRPGHARVRLACPGSRVATFVDRGDVDALVVNHGTVDRVYDQEPGVPAGWTASWAVASAFGIVDAHRDTRFSFANVWGPRADDYSARLDVHAPDGRLVCTTTQPVPRDALVEVSLRDAVRAPGTYHVEIALDGGTPGRERPHTLDLLVGIETDGNLDAEVQVGGSYFNAPVPPGVRWRDVRRTRVFGRVDQSDGRRTRLFLAYPAGQPAWGPPTSPLLTLISADGTRRGADRGDPAARVHRGRGGRAVPGLGRGARPARLRPGPRARHRGASLRVRVGRAGGPTDVPVRSPDRRVTFTRPRPCPDAAGPAHPGDPRP